MIIFDPSTSKNQIDYFIRQPSNRSAHIFRRSLASFQKPVYQILAVQGLLEVGEREVSQNECFVTRNDSSFQILES